LKKKISLNYGGGKCRYGPNRELRSSPASTQARKERETMALLSASLKLHKETEVLVVTERT